MHPQAKAIPIPGILGIVVGLLVGWFIFRVGKEASLKKLLLASTVVLLFIAGEIIILPQYYTLLVQRLGFTLPTFSPGFIARAHGRYFNELQ